MTTRTVLTWIAEVAAWEARGAALPAATAETQYVHRENGPHHIPSPDEIRAAIQEIQAGWSEKERLSRIVGKSRPTAWKVPRVTIAFGELSP